jgi:hypothetical protein
LVKDETLRVVAPKIRDGHRGDAAFGRVMAEKRDLLWNNAPFQKQLVKSGAHRETPFRPSGQILRRWSPASIEYHEPGKSENKPILPFRSDAANKQTTKLLSA